MCAHELFLMSHSHHARTVARVQRVAAAKPAPPALNVSNDGEQQEKVCVPMSCENAHVCVCMIVFAY
jgi:hypothetical protein